MIEDFDLDAALTKMRQLAAGYQTIQLNDEALSAAAVAVEDMLVWMRDDRVSELTAANGFVIREQDGAESSVIRLRTITGLQVGIRAYLKAVERGK